MLDGRPNARPHDVASIEPWSERVDLGADARRVDSARSQEPVDLHLANDQHAHVPAFASPWGGVGRSGGPNGESHFFWEKTSHLQAITCRTLSEPQVAAILEALGARSLVEPR